MYPELNYTAYISKDYFCCFPINFMRELHIPSNKTNGKGKVRTRVSQVQKGTNKLTIQSSIYFRCRTSDRRFDSRLEGRWRWFTILHVKATEKITCILRVGEGNNFLSLQDLEAKKIMQVLKASHFKLLLEA